MAFLRRFFNSLVARVLALGMLLVGMGGLGRFIVLPGYLRGEISILVAEQQANIAREVAQYVDNQIVQRLTFLRALGASLPPALLDQPDQLKVWLEERQGLLPLFAGGLHVISSGGSSILANTPVAPGLPQLARHQAGFGEFDWFLGARNQGLATIGRPYRDLQSNKPVLVLAVPVGRIPAVEGKAGSPRAVLAGLTALDAPGFLDVVSKAKLGETGGMLLISPRDRVFVSSSDPGMILKDTPAPGVNLLHDRAMAGFRGVGKTINASGVEELAAIASVPSADWFLVVRTPTAEAFRVLDRLRDFIMHYGLAMSVLVSGILFLALPRMFRPLRDAAREIQRMAEGKTDLRPLPIVREDEVGTLVAGFNYLLEQVQSREEELREREAQMARKAHHDPLTGLPNRAMFSQRLQEEIAFTDVAQTSFALMFLDLDGFKPVNDGWGHASGDEVLRQVAGRLRAAVRPADILARLGGDEFVIVTPTGMDDPRTVAEEVAHRCLAAIGLPFVVAGNDIRIGLSIGIAFYPQDGREAALLMGNADAALYDAKNKGRGRFEFFHEWR